MSEALESKFTRWNLLVSVVPSPFVVDLLNRTKSILDDRIVTMILSHDGKR